MYEVNKMEEYKIEVEIDEGMVMELKIPSKLTLEELQPLLEKVNKIGKVCDVGVKFRKPYTKREQGELDDEPEKKRIKRIVWDGETINKIYKLKKKRIKRIVWDGETINKIYKLKKKGFTWDVIALKIGTTKNAVMAQFYKTRKKR